MAERPEQHWHSPYEDDGPYRAFFENSTDAMFIGNPDGSIIDVNAAWLDLFGYTRDELPGFNIANAYVNPRDRQQFLRSMSERGVTQDEIRFRRKDGTEFDCERTSIALRDERGKLTVFQGIMRDVTWRRKHERALHESQENYQALFQNTMDAVALVSPGGLLLEANDAYLQLFGYTQDDVGVLNTEEQYVNEEAPIRFLEWMTTNDSLVDEEVRLRRRDGTAMDCLRNMVVRRDANGSVIGGQVVIRDITERKQSEEELRASEQRFRSLFEQSMDAIYIVNYDGSNIRANAAWLDLFGYTQDELPKLNIIDVYQNPEDRQALLHKMARAGLVEEEARFRKKDGTVFDCARTVAARKDESGNVVAFQGIMRDITRQKRERDELQRLARYDTLTGLLNRRALIEKLDEWLRHVDRYRGRLCIIMLDLDHFKRVNDDYGHQAGDHVLSTTANVIGSCVRETDFVGRYGGEEFLVILPRTDMVGGRVVAERIRTQMENTRIDYDAAHALSLTVSLGVAERSDGDGVDAIVGRADVALYRAKENGRNRVELADGTQ